MPLNELDFIGVQIAASLTLVRTGAPYDQITVLDLERIEQKICNSDDRDERLRLVQHWARICMKAEGIMA